MALSPYALRQRILVCDDDLDIIKTLTMILEKKYEVVATSDGQEALNCIEAVEPDLLILDAMMPIMSGYEVTDLVRKNDAVKDIPIIMLSGLDSMRDHRTGYEHGITLYLTKPFMPDILLKNVELELFKLGRPPQKKYSVEELDKKYHFAHSTKAK